MRKFSKQLRGNFRKILRELWGNSRENLENIEKMMRKF